MNNKYNFQKFNYIQYTEPNIFDIRNYFFQNTQNKNKNISNNKKLNRFRSATKINKNNNMNKVNNFNRNIYSTKTDIFDIRIYFCLKMLGLSHLQNIFEKNRINFDELLILSMKDLEMLQIPKNEQIKIKTFSLDYIKNASYYSVEELEKYFINIKNRNNYRKAISARNMRKNNINNLMNNNNPINYHNQYDANIYRNYPEKEFYNSYSNFNNIYNNSINGNNTYEDFNRNTNYKNMNFVNGVSSSPNIKNKINDCYNYKYLSSSNNNDIFNEQMSQRQNNYLMTNKIDKY
jgi:hypothetical protein